MPPKFTTEVYSLNSAFGVANHSAQTVQSGGSQATFALPGSFVSARNLQ